MGPVLTLDPAAALTVLGLGVVWAWAGRRARRRPDRRRQACWWGGVALLAFALLGPIGRADATSFTWHMAQHLLLELAVAPLLLLADPVALALQVLGADGRRRLRAVLRSPVAHPATGWLAFAAVAWGVHLSPLYELAARNSAAHALEHTLFLGAAVLFWAPVVGQPAGGRPLPHGLRVAYLAAAAPVQTFLALTIYSSTQPLYAVYPKLTDQRGGAALMWMACDLTVVGAVLLVVAAWLRHEERVTLMLEEVGDAVAAGNPGAAA